MNIFKKLKEDILKVGTQIYDNMEMLKLANIEIPKDPLHGDLSTNIAMIVASKINLNAREVAIKFKDLLSTLPYIAHIEIAGGGFINFTIKASSWQESLNEIISNYENFSTVNIGNGEKINIEYVSANPTGPMHIGHSRGAVYGDALARLLKKCGYNVVKEYYINDAGSQVNTLIKTTILRYHEALSREKITIPEGLYPGEYLISVGQKLAKKYDDKLLAMSESECWKIVKEFTINEMMGDIKQDLINLGIEHDIFFSEQSLHDNGTIEEAISELTKVGLIYEGALPPPKGKIDEEWEERIQPLFRSTAFGDDMDRPIKKSNGDWAYIGPDLGYAKDKIKRGFTNLIYVLGADHIGYVKRIEAVVKALSKGKIQCNVKLCQLVNFIENGVPIKMSKRSGTFTTVRDVMNEVGKNILRFIMLTRKNDAILDFDLQKVKEQSKDNPVFYVQYAHVRTISILNNGKEYTPTSYSQLLKNEYDLSLLSSEEEIQIIKLLSSWPKILEGAAKNLEPHRIAFYLINIASKFHSLWNLGKENNDYRFVLENNIELTTARLALAISVQKIIADGFEVIGVTPMTKM